MANRNGIKKMVAYGLSCRLICLKAVEGRDESILNSQWSSIARSPDAIGSDPGTTSGLASNAPWRRRISPRRRRTAKRAGRDPQQVRGVERLCLRLLAPD
jgi:hypothetical protein